MLLKGVNLGNWLLMEGYISGGRNIAVREFKFNPGTVLKHTSLPAGRGTCAWEPSLRY